MNTLAPRLREALEERNISQEALARACHVSLRTAHRWVNGDAQPRYADILAIARALEVDPEDLVGDQDDDSDLIRRKQFVARISTPDGLRDELLNALLAEKRDAISGRRRLERRQRHVPVDVDRRVADRRLVPA